MFFSQKVRKLEKKVLEYERKGSVVRRFRIPKSWNMLTNKYDVVMVPTERLKHGVMLCAQ